MRILAIISRKIMYTLYRFNFFPSPAPPHGISTGKPPRQYLSLPFTGKNCGRPGKEAGNTRPGQSAPIQKPPTSTADAQSPGQVNPAHQGKEGDDPRKG